MLIFCGKLEFKVYIPLGNLDYDNVENCRTTSNGGVARKDRNLGDGLGNIILLIILF